MNKPRVLPADDGEDEDASENSDEYAERQAGLQRILMANYAGPVGAAAMQEHARADLHRERSARIGRLRAELARLVELQQQPGPATPYALLPDDSPQARDGSTSTLTKTETRRNPTARRLDECMARLHAALASSPPSGSPEQRLLCAAAARPPWPPLVDGGSSSSSGDTALTLARATALVESFLGGVVAGVVALSDTAVALVMDTRVETLPLALAVVLVAPAAAAAVTLPPTFWPRSHYMPPAAATVVTSEQGWRYLMYAWTPLELAVAAAAGTGTR